MAWTLVSGMYKVSVCIRRYTRTLLKSFQLVDRTFKVDRRVLNLVSTLADTFAFARTAQALRDKYASLREPITVLLKQAIECCTFVRHYAGLDFAREFIFP